MLTSGLIITILSAGVLVLVGIKAYLSIRADDTSQRRGSDPGTGHHVIHSEYSSGLSGHHTTYKIPRDPQEYAKFFVPKKKTDKSK